MVASFAYNSSVDLSGVKSVLEQNLSMQAGTHYSFATGASAWHLSSDEQGRVFICITASEYPSRVAAGMVDELCRTFVAKAGEKSLTAKEKGLDKACRGLFEKICQKYDNVNALDALSGVVAKVESVKLVMQDNVEMALRNCVTLESIEKKAEELQTQAGVFKKTAKEIKNKMWWKNLKMKLAIAGIILAILAVILAITIPKAKAVTGGGGDD